MVSNREDAVDLIEGVHLVLQDVLRGDERVALGGDADVDVPEGYAGEVKGGEPGRPHQLEG